MRILVITFALTVTACFSLLPCVATAQTSAGSATQSPPAQAVAHGSEEAAVLRGQLETMQQYDQRLLNTVYWSLGIVMALAISLALFQGWASYRVYDRDLVALRETLHAYAAQELGTIRNTLQAEQRSEFDKTEKHTQETITSAISPLREEVKNKIQEIRSTLIALERDLAIAEGERWEEKDVQFNAARSYCKAIDLALQIGFLPFVDAPLESLNRCLRKVPKLKARSLANAGALATISQTLSNIPSQYKVVVDGLQSLLKEFGAS